MALFLAFVSITANAQIETILPLSLNKVDIKTDGLKGPVKSMRKTQHQYDVESDESVVFEFLYEYNTQGNIIRKEEFGQYEIIQYDKTGMKRIGSTSYSKGDNHTIRTYTYKYNKEGNLSQYLEETDTTVINYEYTYLKNGKIDEYVAYLRTDSSHWAKTDLVYANGKLCNIICYGATRPIWLAAVDGAYDIVNEEISYGNDGNIRRHTAFEYDSNGNVYEKTVYNGEHTDITTYKYNEYGDCIIELLPLVGKVRKINYEGYDSYGNWTKKQWYDGCRQITEVRNIEYYE